MSKEPETSWSAAMSDRGDLVTSLCWLVDERLRKLRDLGEEKKCGRDWAVSASKFVLFLALNLALRSCRRNRGFRRNHDEHESLKKLWLTIRFVVRFSVADVQH